MHLQLVGVSDAFVTDVQLDCPQADVECAFCWNKEANCSTNSRFDGRATANLVASPESSGWCLKVACRGGGQLGVVLRRTQGVPAPALLQWQQEECLEGCTALHSP